MRTVSDKVLKNRAFETAKHPKCNGYQRKLANMVYKFFDTHTHTQKKTRSGAIATSKVGASVTEELAEEPHRPVIKRFKRKKVDAKFKDKDNIWQQILLKWKYYPPRIEVLNICYVHICFHQICMVKSLKYEKSKSAIYGFTEIVNKSKPKPNKL